MTGETKVEAAAGESRGCAPAADLSSAGVAIAELHRLWPGEGITVYVGLDNSTNRVCVGYLRNESRKAVRLSGATVAEAVDNARRWSALNPARAGI